MTLWTGKDVSVYIPTLPDRAALLQRAVESIRGQIEQPIAVYIAMDVAHRGAGAMRNLMLAENPSTEWAAWLDDDDEFLPNHLLQLLVGANTSGADLIFTYPQWKGWGDGDPLDTRGQDLLNEPFGPAQQERLMSEGNFIPVTFMVRTALVNAVGGFPAPYSMPDVPNPGCEDYLLLRKLIEAGATFHHVTGIRTWIYHLHESNTGFHTNEESTE
jgi:hypothetical protein